MGFFKPNAIIIFLQICSKINRISGLVSELVAGIAFNVFIFLQVHCYIPHFLFSFTTYMLTLDSVFNFLLVPSCKTVLIL